MACMADDLLRKIDTFLELSTAKGKPISDWTFGYRAVNNGRLLERLRTGCEIYRSTERRVLDYITAQTQLLNAASDGENKSRPVRPRSRSSSSSQTDTMSPRKSGVVTR